MEDGDGFQFQFRLGDAFPWAFGAAVSGRRGFRDPALGGAAFTLLGIVKPSQLLHDAFHFHLGVGIRHLGHVLEVHRYPWIVSDGLGGDDALGALGHLPAVAEFFHHLGHGFGLGGFHLFDGHPVFGGDVLEGLRSVHGIHGCCHFLGIHVLEGGAVHLPAAGQ